jgi:organic radical activating enzyme
LETNGTLPERLEQIIDLVDSVSMDIKIKSSAGEEGQWETNRRFLRIAHRKPVWVKVVVSAETTTEEITRAASVVASVHPGIPLIIQPVTPNEEVRACPAPILLSLHETARRYLHTVRVIPQTHKTLGLR